MSRSTRVPRSVGCLGALLAAGVALSACQTADTPRVASADVTSPAEAARAQADVQARQTAAPAVPPSSGVTAAAPAAARPDPISAPADVAAIPRDAKRTASGLAYRVLERGKGTAHPTASSQVSVHYSGWTTDGRRFDSSVARGQPAQFGVGRLIPGWTEGLQLMVEGDRWRLWVPSKLAYDGAPGMPAGMLVFDVELIKIL